MSEIDNDKLQTVLANVTGPEGFVKLVLDTEHQVKRLVSKIEAHEKQIATIQRTILETRGSLRALEQMLNILRSLYEKWGLGEIGLIHSMEILADQDGVPQERIIEEIVKTIDPETKARKDAGKFCMRKDRKTKKWCQRRLSGKKAKETGYCKTCRELLFGEAGK